MTKILVIRTCGLEEGVEADFALLEFDNAVIASAKKSMDMAKKAKKEDESFFDMNFHDATPTFISTAVLENLKLDLPEDWIDEDDGEPALVDSEKTLHDLLNGKETERMSSCMLTATPDSFWWTGSPKYVGGEVTTNAIEEKELDKLL